MANTADIVARLLAGDRRALARVVTLIENGAPAGTAPSSRSCTPTAATRISSASPARRARARARW